MTTTKKYDLLDRLLEISSAPSADSVLSFGYEHNDANQRTKVSYADGSYWLYEYDKLGQLSNAKRHWTDGVLVAGQQFEYTYDDIGNRKQTKEGGDENGAGLRTANLHGQFFESIHATRCAGCDRCQWDRETRCDGYSE